MMRDAHRAVGQAHVTFVVMPDKPAKPGRVRPPTVDEIAGDETIFRPDAVLALSAAPGLVTPIGEAVAALLDGVRPLARVKKRAGVSTAQLREALLQLEPFLRVVGIVEEAAGGDEVTRGLQELGLVDSEMIPQGPGDLIPTRVMAEIQAMVDDARAVEREPWDEPTDVITFDDGGRDGSYARGITRTAVLLSICSRLD